MRTIVLNSLLVSFGIELNSWVTLNLKTNDSVEGGVELGDDEVFYGFDVVCKLIPNWSEIFAVAAPGGVVFDEHVQGGILYNILPVLSDQGCEAVDSEIFR